MANTPRLVSLQSDAHEELLNVIDDLRSQGISRFVDLPQIIVCGDQSSGKSSVLEAVSKVKFPVKDNVCTRFATELILRRGPESRGILSIQPGDRRSESDRTKLNAFRAESATIEDIPRTIDRAKAEMDIDDFSKNFSNDVLRIELTGPEQPHLTLVDLPGLFHAGNKKQSAQEADMVRSLVLSYMKKQRSIILAVVSAKNDLANQIITKLARDLDPQGLRTLGIITKPDTLHAGSDTEAAFFELAENKDINFRLGWHVLVNRDFDTRNATTEERDEGEREFLSKGIWTNLPMRSKGIDTLKLRLSSVLRDQILSELPSLTEDVQSGIDDCVNRLARLGDSRATIREQREYLQKVGTDFANLIKCSIDGVYNHEFFSTAMEHEGYDKRLRAKVQNICLDFADDLRLRGHYRKLYTKSTVKELPEHTDEGDPIPVWRDDYLDDVQYLMRRSRGCELPGLFNPHIVVELFFEQSRKWKNHVEQLITDILEASAITIDLILQQAADEHTGDRLMRHIINPVMNEIKRKLDKRAKELLEPHQQGHLITYNHYFTDNVLKARHDSFNQNLENKLRRFFGVGSQDHIQNFGFSLQSLINSLKEEKQEDMDRYACSDATDCMLAYYKVAMKVLIDDVSKLGIEKRLMKRLSTVLTAQTVNTLEDAVVQDIAGETEESIEERRQATDKLRALEKTLDVLERLKRHRPSERKRDPTIAAEDITYRVSPEPEERYQDHNQNHSWPSPPRSVEEAAGVVEVHQAEEPLVVRESTPVNGIRAAWTGSSARKSKKKGKKSKYAMEAEEPSPPLVPYPEPPQLAMGGNEFSE